jgi:HD-like signal output (HDOD) protein
MNQEIIKKIKLLPPLPESIQEVSKICDDPDSSLRDLVDVINKDPLAVATLLKVANSAIYGAKRVHTVETAVGMFGKAIVRSFLVNSVVMNSFKINLSPYGIDSNTYLKVAYERMILVDKWYSHINDTILSDLILSVQLMSIGQVIVANEAIRLGKSKDFLDEIFGGEDLAVVEYDNVGFNAIDVTVEVLKHWKFQEDLVNSIKYSASLETIEEAPEDIKERAIVNFIAFHTINEIGDISQDNESVIYDVINQYDLNEGVFEETLEELRNI